MAESTQATKPKKRIVVAVGLLLLGVAMLIIGIAGGMWPPALTGVGFLLLAWDRAPI